MTDPIDLPRIDRRRLLNGVVVLGVAAPVLAACGSDEPTASSTPDETGGSPSEAGSPTEPADGGNGGGGGGNGGGGGDELVAAADVPVGGGVVLDDQKVVVTQPAQGEYKAFTAVCTHQGCVVATVEDNNISCPCHGSQFSAEDGSVVTGPAGAPLTEIPVQVQGGSVVRA
jgi:Rieske Fe-S protein